MPSYNLQTSSTPTLPRISSVQSATSVTPKSTIKQMNEAYSHTSNSGGAANAVPNVGNSVNRVGVSHYDIRPMPPDSRNRASSLASGGSSYTRTQQNSHSQQPYRTTTLLPQKQQYHSTAPRSMQAPSQHYSQLQQQRLTTDSLCNGPTALKSQVSSQAPTNSVATTNTATFTATASVAIAKPASQPLSSGPDPAHANQIGRANSGMFHANFNSASLTNSTKKLGQDDVCEIAQRDNVNQREPEQQRSQNPSSNEIGSTVNLVDDMDTKSHSYIGADLSNITSIERLNNIESKPLTINMKTDIQDKSNTITNNISNKTNNISDNNVTNINASSQKETVGPVFSGPYVRKKSRPKKNPVVVTPDPPQATKKTGGLWTAGKFDTRGSPQVSTPFTWDLYLKISPFKVAPREAFRQPEVYPKNTFSLGMKLEAKDPRNSNNWCLASVVGIEGLHLRLRFEGSDAMNDLYELVDSENIRSVGAKPGDPLLPPTGFKGNLAQYPKFVEKVLTNEKTIIAPPECFPPTPGKPTRNLFQEGMKLEAVDRKNRDLICPATIGEVNAHLVKIVFDGWRGSFDYSCEYHSRDLFPINWCRDVGRPIQPPNGWQSLVSKEMAPPPTASPCPTPTKLSTSDLTGNSSASKDSSPQLNEKTQSAGKKRGRPSKQPSPQTSVSRVFSSTPKKNGTKQDSLMGESHESSTSEENCPDLDEESKIDNPATNKFQCQRTVPYSDWKRRQENQMPQEPSNSDIINNNAANTSFSLSDSISMVSTLSYQQESDDRRPADSDESPPLKKPKANSPSGSLADKSTEKISETLKDKTGDKPGGKPQDIPEDKPGNRKGDKPGDRRAEIIESKSRNLSDWSVDDVLDLIRTEDTLVKYSNVFIEHEIDGEAFKLLTTDILINHMGLKIGPVLKINNLLDQVKRQTL